MAEEPTSAPSPLNRLTDVVRRAELQANNPRFNEQFREELRQSKFTREELEDLSRQFEASGVERIRNDARSVILEQIREERQSLAQSIDPRTWSKETQVKAAVTAGSVLAGGALIAFIASKVAKKAGETGRKIRNGALWLIGGTAAAAGVVLGIKAWQNWGEVEKLIASAKSVTDKMARLPADMQEQAEKQYEEMRQKYEEMTGVAGEKLDEITGRADAARAKSEEVKTKVESEAVIPTTPPVEASDGAITNPETGTENSEIEIQKKEAAEAVERNALELTSKGLILMFSELAEQAGLTEEAERSHVAIIINNPDLAPKLSVSQLRSVRSLEDATELFPELTTDAEKKAVLFLSLVSSELEKRIEKTLPTGANINTFTLRDVIDRSYHMPRMFSRIHRGLQGKSWKDAASLAEGFASAFAEDSINDLQEDPALANTFEQIGLKKDDRAFFFAHCIANGRSMLLRQVTVSSEEPQMRRIETALTKIYEELQRPEVSKHLEKYLHGRTDKNFTETFRKQLSENLLMLDAVQLFAYLQLSKHDGILPENLSDSSPVGALLVQMKVLDLVGKQDKELSKHLYTDLAIEAAGSAATGSSAIDLPPETRDFLAHIVSEGSSIALNFGQDHLQNTYENALIGLYEFNRKHPDLTITIGSTSLTGITFLSAVQAARQYRIGSTGRVANNLMNTGIERFKPTNFLSWFDYTASGQDAWDTSTARTRGEAIRNIDLDVIRNITDESLKGQMRNSYNSLHYRGYSEQSFQAFYEEMAELKKQGFPTTEIDEVVNRVKTQVYPLREALQKRRFGYMRRHWRNALPWQRTAWTGGVAVQGYAVYEDLQGIGEAWEQEKQVEKYAQSVMDEIRIQLTTDGQFEAVPGKANTYKHKTSNVEVSLNTIQKTLEKGAEALDERTMAQYMRAGSSVASLGATLIMGAKVFSGPAGLAIAAVEVTVRTGINAWEQGKMRDFLRDAPPWLLPAIGVEQSTGTTEVDWLAKGSSWMMSDLWKGDIDKAEMRSKMLFTIFNQDLRTFAPELFENITRGLDAPPLLDTLYQEDFKKIILPAFYIRLFETARNGGIHWQSIKKADIDSGLVVIPPSVTLVEIREAMRDASILYSQHLNEKRYMETLKDIYALKADGKSDPVLEGVASSFGEEYALGIQLADLSAESLSSDGRTRTQLMLETLSTRLDSAKGDYRNEMLEENARLFRLSPGSIPGISKDISLNRTEVLSFIRDPVLREKLSHVFPQTTAEAEGAETPQWQEWTKVESWKIWLEPPVGVDRTESTHQARIAANFVRQELGMPDLPGNASFDATAHAITEAGIMLISQSRSSAQRNPALEQSMYEKSENRPLVFSSLNGKYQGNTENQAKLCRMLRSPNTSQAEFAEKNMIAVFFEGRTQEKSGHDVVLVTYIFKGPAGKESDYRIVQEAAATGATSNSTGYITGLATAMSGSEFITQPNAINLLSQLKKGEEQRRIEEKEEEKKYKEALQQRGTEWEKSQPEREKIMDEMRAMRAESINRSKQEGAIVYVPGEYVSDEKNKALYQNPGSVRGTINGTEITLPLPSDSSQPSISAYVDRSKVRKPTESELFRFSAMKDGKQYNYKISIENLIRPPSTTFTAEDQRLVRSLLVKPLNLTGHPRENDSDFTEEIQKYELNRLLDIATYKASFRWDAPRYHQELSKELLPYYQKAKNKELFLNTLLNNLLLEQTISSSSYSRILKRMKQQY